MRVRMSSTMAAVAALATLALRRSPGGARRPEAARRDLRRGRDVLRQPRSRLPDVQGPEDAAPARRAALGRAPRRREHAAGQRGGPRGSGVRLVAVRPDGAVREPVRAEGAVLDRRHAVLGERRQAREPGAAALRRPAEVRRGRGHAVQRQFVGDDGRTLPAVRYWAAWNEPNNPVFLAPQYTRARGDWVIRARRLRQDLQRRLRRDPRDAAAEREGRLRRDGAARQQQPRVVAPVGLAARVPPRREDGGHEDGSTRTRTIRTTASRTRRRRRSRRRREGRSRRRSRSGTSTT